MKFFKNMFLSLLFEIFVVRVKNMSMSQSMLTEPCKTYGLQAVAYSVGDALKMKNLMSLYSIYLSKNFK